ncbi:Protein of unknown function [Pyronema omphalodes CBS 100304]|uniref:Uncharacterized protein n=1 Tax=Pyronema omphalodes (strain CBS 100304) TaxID=1076935 RepID=U4KVD2_PYROM|nr:Protein of unknown function [Pyronema omphalodes CBS 100304]
MLCLRLPKHILRLDLPSIGMFEDQPLQRCCRCKKQHRNLYYCTPCGKIRCEKCQVNKIPKSRPYARSLLWR